MIIGSLITPLVLGTHDYSYFLDGPLASIIKTMICNMFLLLVYEKKVSKTPNIIEYMHYYIYSVVLYVTTTMIICLIPDLHEWVINNIYLTPFQYEKIRETYYYTRIGWGGFSGFNHTLSCTMALICNSIIIFYYRNKKKIFWKHHLILIILAIGNMCYGRSGFVVSILCLFIQTGILFHEKRKEILIYPLAIISLGIGIISLKNYNAKIKAWYDWCFSIINSYISTGELSNSSLNSMWDMYFLPKIETLLVGDGRYTEGAGYYMNTDIGWIRPILNYGVFYTLLGYISSAGVIGTLKKRLSFLRRSEQMGITIMWLLTLISFETKGEVFYVIIAFILPLCLLKNSK